MRLDVRLFVRWKRKPKSQKENELCALRSARIPLKVREGSYKASARSSCETACTHFRQPASTHDPDESLRTRHRLPIKGQKVWAGTGQRLPSSARGAAHQGALVRANCPKVSILARAL